MSVESLNTGAEVPVNTPSPEGHEAAMTAKFDAAQENKPEPKAEEAPKATRPDHIPEKFWDAEKGEVRVDDLAKSYAELEKGKAQPEGKKPDEVTTEEAGQATSEQAKAALESVGLDFDAMSSRFSQSGELHADDRKALKDKGIPDTLIDSFIAGQVAQADAFAKTVYDSVGGQDEYTKIVSWAATGLSKEDAQAYNKVMEGNDPGAIKLAVQGLQAKYQTAYGQDPQFVQAVASNSSGSVFRSNEELKTAMADPRYAKDKAYREDVIAKLNRSSLF